MKTGTANQKPKQVRNGCRAKITGAAWASDADFGKVGTVEYGEGGICAIVLDRGTVLGVDPDDLTVLDDDAPDGLLELVEIMHKRVANLRLPVRGGLDRNQRKAVFETMQTLANGLDHLQRVYSIET